MWSFHTHHQSFIILPQVPGPHTPFFVFFFYPFGNTGSAVRIFLFDFTRFLALFLYMKDITFSFSWHFSKYNLLQNSHRTLKFHLEEYDLQVLNFILINDSMRNLGSSLLQYETEIDVLFNLQYTQNRKAFVNTLPRVTEWIKQFNLLKLSML